MNYTLGSGSKGEFDPQSNQKFSEEEFDLLRQFSAESHFEDGEIVFKSGQTQVPFCFVVSGALKIIDESQDELTVLTTHGAYEFSGDISIFADRQAIATAQAVGETTIIKISSDQLRELLIVSPSFGDKVIETLIRRRQLLEAGSFRGVRIYGRENDPATLDLREFLYRNGIGHEWLNIAEQSNINSLKTLGAKNLNFPILVSSENRVFERPRPTEIASHLGIQRDFSNDVYDTLIIGSGPSGLGAAVYAASEGLKTLVIDRIGPGGQAGSSSKIENYAGFPVGLSGRELALRAQLQALKFGAEISSPCSPRGIERDAEGVLHVDTCIGKTIHTKTVIVATGVSYRQLTVSGLTAFRNRGIYYSATKVESVLCDGQPVHIIGGGNSAGQAAMFLSETASHVHMILRGGDINKSMSSYLSSRVIANPKITVHYYTEVDAVSGDDRIKSLRLKNNQTDATYEHATGGMFIFIGAVPNTDFLDDQVIKDKKGFIVTGSDLINSEAWKLPRNPHALESSLPGLFASGDCRSGTTKRVAFAIGDGALAITSVHDLLGTYR